MLIKNVFFLFQIIWQSELLTLANNDHDRQNATIELEKFMKQFVSNRKEFAEEDLKVIPIKIIFFKLLFIKNRQFVHLLFHPLLYVIV